MRMTNKIMQNNSLYNINATKIAEDKLTTQMTTQSKIDKPSDDPVVAIRALRLRTNVSEVLQYHEKNAPDADQWLDVTAGSLTTVTDILTDLYKQAEKASNKDLTASDLKVILDQLKSYTHEFYATGNQDYAGRYIFTGYRTDTPLTFTKAHTTSYEITEMFKEGALDTVSYTDYSVLTDKTRLPGATEQAVDNTGVSRIRLAYTNLSADVTQQIKDANGNVTGYTQVPPQIELRDSAGNLIMSAADFANIMVPDAATPSITRDEAYRDAMTQTADKAYYIAETGELVLSKSLAQKVESGLSDSGSLSVTYEKDNWKVDDLNPQHYFRCVSKPVDPATNAPKPWIEYNKDGDVNTVINYDVGFNQKIQINTNASEVFIHDLYRDIDDLTQAIAELEEVENLRKELKEKQEGFVEGSTDYETVQKQIDAADKAFTYVRDRVQQMMTGQMSKYQDYLDITDLAITQNGTRSTRLLMIGSRLMDQKEIYRELQEENEGIDMPEVAVNLASAKMTYDAALQATSKILQNSLMNYI